MIKTSVEQCTKSVGIGENFCHLTVQYICAVLIDEESRYEGQRKNLTVSNRQQSKKYVKQGVLTSAVSSPRKDTQRGGPAAAASARRLQQSSNATIGIRHGLSSA